MMMVGRLVAVVAVIDVVVCDCVSVHVNDCG